MGYMKYCRDCQDYYPKDIYPAHMKQHQVGNPAVEHKQFLGTFRDKSNDYMVCILHQKKCPCPVKGCRLMPLGCIRKSYMLEFIKSGTWITTGYDGKLLHVPIDSSTRTVTLMGIPVKLKA